MSQLCPVLWPATNRAQESNIVAAAMSFEKAMLIDRIGRAKSVYLSSHLLFLLDASFHVRNPLAAFEFHAQFP